ncbi:uncharacterized protein LY89DRAFT_661060 [Mollisia scopiformis]|uniref:Uncharacterized protein n=1 Tax=Mollisia scopiformis TaxID=149040 RepID=A0A132B4U9_MOLSC|nr:uncharacterized protein LY89DRAFT_661060 [Mollisia scopiformis]KUJ06934.1 hypothetical protein LY89DRAFT_661060 [Mollisia scopiformis]
MVYAPPSYQAAAYRQLWAIVAPYVQDEDLYSTCLVSRQFHQAFAPRLWGSPASRFGSDSDTVYLSLTRFKRLLNRARLEVRRLAHTLHIPPAETEFYGGPQAGWLRDILDRLPALQALNVSNLSFFDHQSLQTIHSGCQTHTKYPLKLLVASGCLNTTASSLSMALSHFPELIYLDLSGAQGSRNPYVLRQIGTLHNLRVLKLRNCGLRDDDIDHLSFTPRLRSLDLSQNFLTQRGVYKLSTLLPMPAPLRRETVDSLNPVSPFARRYSGIPLPARVLSQGVENFVAGRLMRGMDGDVAIEEGLPKSFSHLYLASNYVSIDHLSRLIERPDLQYLDAGSLSLNQSQDMLSPKSAGSGSARFSNPPETETLSPALFTHAFRNLRSLRLHYSVVTSNPFSGKELAVEEQCFELHGEDLRYELDSTQVLKPGTFFELEDTSQNITQETESLQESTKEKEKETETEPDVENGTEIHATFESPDDVRAKVNPTAPMEIKGSSSVGREQNDAPPKPTAPKDIIEEVVQRKHRIEARERHPGRFKPSMLPNLKALTLTDVPSTTRRRNVTDSLTVFIHECAEEEELARLEEAARHHQAANTVNYDGTFKLERLVLEMTSLADPILPSRSPHRNNNNTPHNKRHSFTKSSTEDADSETFMSHSETDFSFFGEDDGGLLVSEGRIDAPMNFDEGMMLEVDDGHVLDVVSELASFRREKKRRFEALERFHGDRVQKALLGHWRGEIKIVKGVLTA